MEEKIHDDRLDQYVRRSFHAYAEDPAPALWERIDAELPPPAPLRLPLFRRYRWTGWAAVLLLVAALAGEHFSWKYKTDRFRFAIAEKSAQQPQIKNGAGQPAKNNPVEMEPAAGTDPSAGAESDFSGAGRQDGRPGDSRNAAAPVDRAIRSLPLRPARDADPVDSGRPAPAARAETKAVFPEAPARPADPVLPASFVSPALVPVAPALLSATRHWSPEPLPLRVEPVRTRSGWYAGIQVRPQIRYDAGATPVRRPGGRPVFVSRQEKPEVTFDYWFKAGKKVGSRLVLESGVGYSAWERTTTHTPRFRFGEGQTGGNPYRRNFSYDLSTYGGSAEISLRMEQVDSDPVPDNEPVSLQITTSESARVLRIPLLVGYRLGHGRLHGNVKAGLTGSFLLHNELSILTRVSQNSRFQPAQGSGSYTVKLESRRKFFPGYWLSAGLELHLTRSLSLIAEPSLTGDFPQNDRLGRRLPVQFSPGIQTGLNYYF